jgi:preprotein translocase subunit YajC
MWNALAVIALQQAPGGRTGMVMVIYLVSFGLIAWFLLIRPQRKLAQRHQAMLAAIKKGDEVMTEGGIIGTVVHLAEDRLTLKTGESTRVVVARMKIARVMTAPEAEKA